MYDKTEITFEKTPRGWEWRFFSIPGRLNPVPQPRILNLVPLNWSKQIQTLRVSDDFVRALRYPTSALKMVHDYRHQLEPLTIR